MNKQIITVLTTGALVFGGTVGLDAVTTTPMEALEDKLLSYDMTISDIVPFDKETISQKLSEKPYTEDEKLVLTAVLEGQIPYFIMADGINVKKVQDIYVGIANKIGITVKDINDEKNLHKIIRDKLK